jgi:hypothetical protein
MILFAGGFRMDRYGLGYAPGAKSIRNLHTSQRP